MKAMKISAVIMLYNEEEVIDEFSERLLKSLRALPLDYEVIFVVEGTDRTLEKVKKLGGRRRIRLAPHLSPSSRSARCRRETVRRRR